MKKKMMIDDDYIFTCVTDIIKAHQKIDDVKREDRLMEDLDIDSLDEVEMTIELESEFDITFDENQDYTARTVQDLIDIIKGKL